MANTVFGPYTKTAWSSGVTALNQTNMNNLETSAQTALNGINADFCGPFVLTGMTCTKDGTNANQLDIASGTAYITMSDGTTGKIAVGSDTTHTTSTPSTTYYLFLKNDGTWQWGTSSSGPANSLQICHATTDGSGNINVVTDDREGAGHIGSPLIVARTSGNGVAVSATTEQVILTYTPPVTGFYRAHLYFRYVNPTPNKVTARVRWTDPIPGTNVANWFFESLGGQLLNGSQATTTGNNQSIACPPMTVRVQAAGTFEIRFTDPGGTPADTVAALIERIS